MRDRERIAELSANPEMFAILVRNAYRGVRVQFLLRIVLLAFMVAVIAWEPPARGRAVSLLLVGGYAIWTGAIWVWTRRGGSAPVRWMWLVLLVDSATLGALVLIAGAGSAEQSWTADIAINGLFLVPVLAATQLRPVVCAAVAIPTTVVYFIASLFTKDANGEPWSSVILRTFVMAGLSVACIGLSRVQLLRVHSIADLARDRAELLSDLTTAESSTRARLAEDLHDGALQYVLAARQDLEDLREVAEPSVYQRLDEALTQTSTLLRATVTDLHPAVLQAAGLSRALRDLTTREAARTKLAITLDAATWPDEPGPLDSLLFSAARELLGNVVKHAGAASVHLRLSQEGGRAQLLVADDGRGIDPAAAGQRLSEGHIGLASLRARIAGAGGTVTISAAKPTGALIVIDVPLQ